MTSRPLRPLQAKAIDDLRQSLRDGHNRVILQAPTGSGKTRLAGEIVLLARAKNKRVCFVVPAISLIDQTVESFKRDGVTDIGVIQADHPLTDPTKPVQVASIQTLAKRGWPDCSLIICDEAHMRFKSFTDWMQHPDWAHIPFIGLSATPWSNGLGLVYSNLIIAATTQQLIHDGWLSPFRVFAPDHPDLSTCTKTVLGDYDSQQLTDAMNKTVLVGNIVETWLRQGEFRPTLCFAVDCAHAKHIQQRFEESGIPCGYIDGYTEVADRNAIRDKYHAGHYKVVTSVGTLTTGIDWVCRCIILARPTKSEILFSQIFGRGLRPEYAEGFDLETLPGRLAAIAAGPKPYLLVLDHADIHNPYTGLGFVTDINYTTLDCGKVHKKTEVKPEKTTRECSICNLVYPKTEPLCPECGHKPESFSTVKYEDGQLKEIMCGKGTKATGPAGQIRVGGKWIDNADFYGQLKLFGKIAGFDKGWSAHTYMDATGTWPNAHRLAPEKTICEEVRAWIKSRAKKRKKESSSDAKAVR